MAELKIDIKADANPIRELNKEKLKLTATLARTIQEFGKESEQAKKAGQELQRVTVEHKKLKNAVTDLSGGLKRSSAQLLEMGENITVVAAGITSALGSVYNLSKESINLSASLNVLRQNFQGTESDLTLFRQATAGTVTDANLIKLSNQANDLGISLKEQALLFSLAEDVADKYGGTVEENFQRVVYATEGNIKGLKSLGIQKALYEQTIRELVKSHNGEVESLKDINGEQEINIKNLDAATQKQIRLEAIFKLTGVTLEKVASKTQDQKDKLDALGVRVEEAKTKFGNLLMQGVEPLITGFLNMGSAGTVAVGTITQIASAVSGLLPAVAGLKIAFGGAFVAAIGTWSAALAGLAAELYNIKFAFEQTILAFGGNWRQSFGAKNLYGVDQTNSEQNAQNETGIFEGIKNRLKNVSDLRNKMFAEEVKVPSYSKGSNKGGKSPRTEQIEQETLAIEEESRALKRLAEDFTKFAYAGIYTEKTNEAFNRQVRPADQSNMAQSPVNNIIESLIKPITEEFKTVFGTMGDTIGNLSIFFGEAGQNFISDMIEGFNRIAGIVQFIAGIFETIKAVQGFVSIVTGLFGFSPGGMAGMITPRVSTSNNIYISSNLDSLSFMKSAVPIYNNYQSYRRL